MAWIYGTEGDDRIVVPYNGEINNVFGYTGADLIEIEPENAGYTVIWLDDGGDTIDGGPGSDRLYVEDVDSKIENVTFHGGAGDDTVEFLGSGGGAGANNVLDGGEGGGDAFWPHGRAAFINLETGVAHLAPVDGTGLFYEATVRNFEHLFGTEGHDIFVGTDDDELFRGAGGHDLLSGRGGTDRLEGSDGDDILVGGRGADGLLSGRGADIIRIDRLVESLPGQEDTILDFTFRDTIDLSRIDADLTTPGNQAFVFIGTAAFSGAAGELRYEAMGTDLLVSADADGDRVADLAVNVRDLTELAAADFIL